MCWPQLASEPECTVEKAIWFIGDNQLQYAQYRECSKKFIILNYFLKYDKSFILEVFFYVVASGENHQYDELRPQWKRERKTVSGFY